MAANTRLHEYDASAAPIPPQSMADEAAGENGRHGPRPAPNEAINRLGRLFGEFKEYLSYYFGARMDGMKISLRNLGITAGLGIVGLIAASAMITTAVALLLVGAAWGLGLLFGGHYWLGAFAVGVLVIGGFALGVILLMKRLTRTFKTQTVDKYEQRKTRQRTQFGRDVNEAAAGQAK